MLKSTLAYLLPALAIVAALGGLVFLLPTRAERRLAELDQRAHLALQQEIIRADLHAVASDLLYLAEEPSLRQFLANSAPEQRHTLAETYRTFSAHKRIYDQIRFLDLSGQEIVRVNYQGGTPNIVSDSDLQAKQERYYVRETAHLPARAVFVSPFDLNIEHGQIEVPHKPTLRFSTPVFDPTGQRRGMVVLNYLGQRLLDQMTRYARQHAGQVSLLNAQGYWLYGGEPSERFAFMFQDHRDATLARRYPDVWQRLAERVEGQFEHPQLGLLTFRTVAPAAALLSSAATATQGPQQTSEPVAAAQPSQGLAASHWYLLSRLPKDQLMARPRQLARQLLLSGAVVALLLTTGSYYLARARVERHQAVKSLEESELRFRQLAEHVDDVFWMRSADVRAFLYVSPAVTRMWHCTPADMIESPERWRAAILSEDLPLWQQAISAAAAGRETDVSYRIRRSDGTMAWIRDRAAPVHDATGAVVRVAGIAEDMTGIRQAQDQLLQRERLAAIGEAMAGLAHESRNALQCSQAGLDLLQRRVADRKEAVELAHQVQQSQQRLYRLYEAVREYAAPLVPRLVPCDLRQVIEICWQQLEPLRRHRPVELLLPSQHIPTHLLSDPFLLETAFRNILENAIAAAAEPGKIVVQWQTVEMHAQPAFRLEWTDNGPGFSAEQAARLFEPFFTTKVQGTGLGMALARRAIEALGGTIEVGQPLAPGARIVVILPRGDA